MNRRVITACSVLCLAGPLSVVAWSGDHDLRVTQENGRFRVTEGDELFCDVDYTHYAKPIVYPIYGPGQVPMTRNHPMEKGVAREASDHPHHKSMWFAHGDVNGVSFWNEQGKVVNQSAEIVAANDSPAEQQQQPTVRLKDVLVDADGETVCQETVYFSFGAGENVRWIDWTVSLHAGDQPIVFGDTKEGTAALRVHPNLRPDQRATRDTDIRPAKAINSEGLEGEAIWGKRAAWVDYSGTIDGKRVGIAFFDNPENFRHPTYWHARPYGLFSANPFGLSHFVGSDHDGSYTLPAGKSLKLRYRIVFHAGDAGQAKVGELYQRYAQQASAEK